MPFFFYAAIGIFWYALLHFAGEAFFPLIDMLPFFAALSLK